MWPSGRKLSSNHSKLNDIINNLHQFLCANDGIKKHLFTLIPSMICPFLFGTREGQQGLFHKNILHKTQFKEFLNPKGPFLTKLLSLQQDAGCLYSISPDYLPSCSKRIFCSGDWILLPTMYKRNMQVSESEHRIMFNMFEYFIFSFAMSPTLISETVSDKRTNSTKLMMDDSYFDILQSYLQYFLPIKIVDFNDDVRQTPHVGRAPSFLIKPLNNSSIFKCKYWKLIRACEDLSAALETANFVYETMIEIWLGQNDYMLFETPNLVKIPVI